MFLFSTLVFILYSEGTLSPKQTVPNTCTHLIIKYFELRLTMSLKVLCLLTVVTSLSYNPGEARESEDEAKEIPAPSTTEVWQTGSQR